VDSDRAWRTQQTPPLASMEPSCEGQTYLRVCALSSVELQAARVSANKIKGNSNECGKRNSAVQKEW
jgi:hypothetical protein